MNGYPQFSAYSPQPSPPQTNGRHLSACGSSCLNPKIDPAAISSVTTFIEVSFLNAGGYYSNYAAPQQPAIAFGICAVIGCNYRNVTVSYVTSARLKYDAIYAVTFYALPLANGTSPVLPPQLNASNTTSFPALLIANLPSNSSITGTIAYFAADPVVGGALTAISYMLVANGTYLNGNPYTITPPPPAPPPGYYFCTCIDGWLGADCSVPPSPPPTPPPSRKMRLM